MTKAKFKKLCEQHNVTFKFDDEAGTIDIDPPAGFVFAATGLHFLSPWVKDWKMADLYDHIAEDFSMGIEKCTETECDYCEDLKWPTSCAGDN